MQNRAREKERTGNPFYGGTGDGSAVRLIARVNTRRRETEFTCRARKPALQVICHMSLTLIVSISAFVGVAALVGGVAMLVHGATDNVAEDRLGALTGKSSKRRRSDKEATVIAKPLNDVPNALEEMASRLLNLTLFLEQAAISISPGNFVILMAGLGLLGAAIVVFSGLSILFAPLGALALAPLPLLWVAFRRSRRKKAFAKQLPEALELIARALRRS